MKAPSCPSRSRCHNLSAACRRCSLRSRYERNESHLFYIGFRHIPFVKITDKYNSIVKSTKETFKFCPTENPGLFRLIWNTKYLRFRYPGSGFPVLIPNLGPARMTRPNPEHLIHANFFIKTNRLPLACSDSQEQLHRSSAVRCYWI